MSVKSLNGGERDNGTYDWTLACSSLDGENIFWTWGSRLEIRVSFLGLLFEHCEACFNLLLLSEYLLKVD